ncbi:GntR family transcriptional regulator [Halanaerobium congolense]|uniref:GntR family transcriptional regulator n=1 Tax=Halanaerobium congolense TaxID=54121 RepID=A0A4R8GJ85_9FIRM|nr:GntR family transcriptional regulator [Halanaerobium congolense]TDX41417.1 GntR family transcriptional regulator [Halanaerobium congolense]
MEKLNTDNRLPLYHQLYDIIVEKIEDGTYKENDKIPSEREFCDKYDISRATVRRTMVELEKNDYIYKKQGKGVFVSSKAFKQDLLSFYSFSEEMKKINKVPSSEVIDFKKTDVSSKIADKLKINKNQKVYKFKRLRLADDEPMMIETTYLPAARFPGLNSKKLDQRSMYDIFREDYNVEFNKADEIFQAISLNKKDAKYLNSNEGSPSILLERFTYENENIIEYTASVTRGDKFKFHVSLE